MANGRWLTLATLCGMMALPWCVQAAPIEPIKALLITGGCCHDYAAQKEILTEGISNRAHVDWTVAHQGGTATDSKISVYESPDWADEYDVIVHNECFAGVDDEAWVDRILEPHRNGTPAVLLHCAMHSYRVPSDAWFEFCGVTSHRHGAKYPFEVVNQSPKHPIMEGFGKSWTTPAGELYLISKVSPSATPLAHAWSRDTEKIEPCVWVNDYHGTRVFGTTVGHHNETMRSREYLDMVGRGLLWAVGSLDGDYLKSHEAKAEEPEMDRENLALGKPASAANNQNGHPPGHAVDGNRGTRWCAQDDGSGYWWQVDLQEPRTITGARIRWEFDGRRYGYRIEGSTDGDDWSLLADRTEDQPDQQVNELDFKAENVRYVRITVTEQESGSWASFYEFAVLGTDRVPAREQQARDNEALLEQVEVADGFDKTMFAGPPDVVYPACVTATPSGELFVGVDRNGSLAREPGRGRILRCSDTDDDGEADRFIVFADNVDSPRGLIYDDGTLYVLHPPKLTAFEDVDGDGVADRSRELVSGIGFGLDFRGADHTTNGIQLGIDGWIYVAVGDYGFIEAIGSDGRSLQLRGGGIVRVRPDGSEMELYARGTRNIYDVAIDPQLNLFTRDNTNDGGGWDVRLSHIIQSAEYGYPSLYKHFNSEIMSPLADYGGGSGTGALYIHEPGFPEGYGDTLYTCDWGRNKVYRHPLSFDGATFDAQQKVLASLSRPLDMTVDGSGNLYIASWNNGGFRYSGEDVGYIARVTPVNGEAHPGMPERDLESVDANALVDFLGSRSGRLRLAAQREALERSENGESDDLIEPLVDLALGTRPLYARVAAIFTLKQIRGPESHSTLLEIAPDDPAFRFALRALTDRTSELENVPTTHFVEALSHPDLRVRRQALIGLGRLGDREAAEAVLRQTSADDDALSHVAVRSLVNIKPIEACLAALKPGTNLPSQGALEALEKIHDPEVVDGLIDRLDSASSEGLRRGMLVALMRLHFQEAPYKGDWWGTRPDTHGPYYKPVEWEETQRIAEVLKDRLLDADESEAGFLLDEMARHQIQLDLPPTQLVSLAKSTGLIDSPATEWLMDAEQLPGSAVGVLKRVAASDKVTAQKRRRAIEGLLRVNDQAGYKAARKAVSAINSLKEADGAMIEALQEFISDSRTSEQIDLFARLAGGSSGTKKGIAHAVLLSLGEQGELPRDARRLVSRALSEAWDQPETVPQLLEAIGVLGLKGYADQVRVYARSDDADLSAAGGFAASRLNIDLSEQEDDGKQDGPTIAELQPDQVASKTIKAEGDPQLGERLFTRQGCVACHTVDDAQAPKGPDLSDVATRYDKATLIESIARPNAVVAQGFATRWFELSDGRVREGFVTREGADEVELRNVAGIVTTIDKEDVVKSGERDRSMMPEGLVGNLTPHELASIVAYLESLVEE